MESQPQNPDFRINPKTFNNSGHFKRLHIFTPFTNGNRLTCTIANSRDTDGMPRAFY